MSVHKQDQAQLGNNAAADNAAVDWPASTCAFVVAVSSTRWVSLPLVPS